MPISFKTSGGASPETIILRIAKGMEPDPTDMLYAAERQRDRMVKRTGQGTDVDGRSFKAYKPGYAKRKEKSGRDSTIVDLTWSGRMLKAMRTNEVTGGSFKIGIYNDEGVRAAVHNYGLGKAPQRRFMGASQQDRKKILNDIVARRIARANGTGLNVALAA